MSTPDDLVEPEGVDGGSAAAAAEGAPAEAPGDLLGPPADVPDPADAERQAAPVGVPTPEEHVGPGQQYQVGEG